MNINSQFPPSSPLLDNEELEVGKPSIISNSNKSIQQSNGYFTPDPSSSLGDTTINSDGMKSDNYNSDGQGDNDIDNNDSGSNHPVSEVSFVNNNDINEPIAIAAAQPTINKIDKSQPLSPKNFHNVIHVPLNGDVFKIGRSGLSCSFKLNSSNKLISRVHAEIYYDQSESLVVLKCVGFNGLNITIPHQVAVSKLEEKQYLISINDNIDTDDEEYIASSSRILNRNSTFTNFYMLKNETIKMPLIEGTVLDFRGELALLVFNNNKITIDPKTQVISKTSITASPIKNKARKLSTGELSDIVKQKKLQFSTHPTLSEIESRNKNRNTEIKSLNDDDTKSGARPVPKSVLSNTIIYKRPTPINTPVRTPVNIHVHDDKENINVPAKPIKETNNKPSIREPLAELPVNNSYMDNTPPPISSQEPFITEHTPTPQSITTQFSIDEQIMNNISKKNTESTSNEELKENHNNYTNEESKKRGRPKKAKQSEEEILKNMPGEEIDSILATVPELDDISNLITNHIAYSRVLQTPFKSLLELNSIKKHQLSKLQLRCVLIHYIDCIGVIFRKGKDAAGKQLDEEYYYVPEKDNDIQRVQLVEELKGSSSQLRSCRKTHKQYFWKKPKI